MKEKHDNNRHAHLNNNQRGKKPQLASRMILTRGRSGKTSNKQVKEISPNNQLASLDASVKFCARKYNEYKAKSDKLQSILSQKKDVLSELKREGASLANMMEGKDNGAKQLSKLRSDIEEVTEACEMKLHYRLQLNYIHLRQTKIASEIDSCISDLSNRISSFETKRVQSVNLLSDAESTLTVAIQEYENKTISIQKERAYRKQEMTVKETEVTSARKIENWRQKQESHINIEKRHDIRVGGEGSDDSIDSFSTSIRGKRKSQRQKKRKRILELEAELTNISKKMVENNVATGKSDSSSEEAFIQFLKKIAGVDSSTEIIQNVIFHKDQKQKLLLEKKEVEGRYVTMKNRLAGSQLQLSNLLSTCSSSSVLHKQTNGSKLQEIIKSMDDERMERKAVNSANIHLTNTFIRVQQGAIGLVQKIILHQGNLLDEELPILDMNNLWTFDMHSCGIQGNTLKIFNVLNYFLCKMLDDLGGIESISHQHLQDQIGDDVYLGDENCRIQSSAKQQVI